MVNVLLSPSGICEVCILIGPCYSVSPIAGQLDRRAKLLFTRYAVLIQSFDLNVRIKVIEHNIHLRVLTFLIVGVVAE